MNLMVVKQFIRNIVSRVEVVVFRVRGGWENMYVVSSPKYSNNINLTKNSQQYPTQNIECWHLLW